MLTRSCEAKAAWVTGFPMIKHPYGDPKPVASLPWHAYRGFSPSTYRECIYIGTCEHRNVEVPTASDGLAGHGLGLGRVYGSHMSRFPCSFGSVRASVTRNTPRHSPPTAISNPLDFERAAATATGAFVGPLVDSVTIRNAAAVWVRRT